MTKEQKKRYQTEENKRRGEMLRSARQAAGITREALAERIYYDASTVAGWEDGANKMHPDVLDAICRELDIGVDQLVGV